MALTSTVLHREDALVVLDVRCGCAAGHRDEEETPDFEVVVPLVGAFVRRSSRGEALVDSAFGYVADAGALQEITHVTDGDRCLALVPSTALADTMGLHGRAVRVERQQQRLVAKALKSSTPDPLARGEAWLRVLSDLTTVDGSSGPTSRAETARRAAVHRVREAIVADPGAAWTLPALGTVAGYAPHHLSRVFRATTGVTVSEYRERVRLAKAIAMLRDGAAVADVAARLGFYDQAHLARRAGEVLGLPPSALGSG